MATVTIKDVAKHADVGIGTVSRVLNESPNVSASTRKRVLSAIAELDYQPNTIARRLSLGKTYTIGVIAPFFTTPSCIERIRGIEHALASTNYDFMLYNVDTAARRDYHFTNVPRKERIDGLIIITLKPTGALEKRLKQRQVPTVIVDRTHPHFNCLTIDDVEGGRHATAHLIALGHRRIGFVSDFIENETLNPLGFVSPYNRYLGYRKALDEAGITFDESLHRQGLHTKRYAYELALELLKMPNPPTAIFASSDTQAIGTLQAAQKLNISVPEQLSIIGYDDIEVAQYLNLTTIRQPLFESGVEAVELLLKQMRVSKKSADVTHRQLPLQLITRQTTAPRR